MSWFGRGELKTLSKFEVPSAPMLLQGVPLYCGYYLNELVLNMMPLGEPSSKIFIKYGTSLESLKSGSNIEETLRSFELTLLDYLGVLPDLQSDEHGEAIQSSKVYRLGDLGFTLCPNEAGTGLWHGEVLLQCAAMLERNDKPLENVSIKPFTRFMVDWVLNGRSLKSREMLKQVMRLKLN